MNAQERTFIDKSAWPEGPWNDEPDRVDWRDSTGLPQFIKRNAAMGIWCGYVGVPKSHPLYEASGDNLDVHGCVSFTGPCAPHKEGIEDHELICHVPLEGETDDIWWFGFDCGHHMDLVPVSISFMKGPGDTEGFGSSQYGVYRDRAYAMAETGRLAKQLAR